MNQFNGVKNMSLSYDIVIYRKSPEIFNKLAAQPDTAKATFILLADPMTAGEVIEDYFAGSAHKSIFAMLPDEAVNHFINNYSYLLGLRKCTLAMVREAPSTPAYAYQSSIGPYTSPVSDEDIELMKRINEVHTDNFE